MPPEKDVSALLIKVLQGDENAKNEVYHELLPVAIRVFENESHLSITSLSQPEARGCIF